MTDFLNRYLKVIIGIGTGQLGDGVGETHEISGHRISAEITAWGGETQGQAIVRIFGLSNSLMNLLTAIGPVMTQIQAANSIQILAGTDPESLSTVYNGTIQTAFANYNNAPDVALEIFATSASLAAMTPAESTSYDDFVSVDKIMNYFATQLKVPFYNVDVAKQLDHPTYNGSYLDQIKACAVAADCDYSLDLGALRIKKPLSFYPNDDVPPVISPGTGMVGYPIFGQQGMTVRSLFLPTVLQGAQIEIRDSQLLNANGLWIVSNVKHELESLLPDGKWFTTIGAYPSGIS